MAYYLELNYPTETAEKPSDAVGLLYRSGTEWTGRWLAGLPVSVRGPSLGGGGGGISWSLELPAGATVSLWRSCHAEYGVPRAAAGVGAVVPTR